MTAEMNSPWRKVTKDEFFKEIGRRDVHPSIQNDRYPYTELWQSPGGKSFGKSVGSAEGGVHRTTWYLPAVQNR